MNDIPSHESHGSSTSIIFRAVLALLILAAAGALAFYFIEYPPEAEKKEHSAPAAPLVKIQDIEHGTYPVKIEVMGQVIPAREVTLKAQVSGEIITTSPDFVPGGFFNADTEVLKIDDADYTIAVKVQTATLNQARAALNLEQGQQSIARDELKILEQSTGKKLKNTDLALRKPQLQQAYADLESAKALLEQAELDLSRTVIKAPFNAMVKSRSADLGKVISAQDELATLVDTNEYWIDIEIPVHDLAWIQIPQSHEESGSKAIIDLGTTRGIREGEVFKTTGSLDSQSRLAGLIVRIPDPLLLSEKTGKASPLVLGDYVRTILIGKILENAARIPLNYIRDGGTLWLYENGQLKIMRVNIVYEDRNFAYITDALPTSSALITSDIITPIDGMALKIADKAPAQSQE